MMRRPDFASVPEFCYFCASGLMRRSIMRNTISTHAVPLKNKEEAND